jgi:hypothetical protein
MVHEFGHFQGYADSMSYAPTDIRYPLLTDANLPAACMSELPGGSTPQSSGTVPLSGRDSKAASARLRIRCFEVGCDLAARRHRTRRR